VIDKAAGDQKLSTEKPKGGIFDDAAETALARKG